MKIEYKISKPPKKNQYKKRKLGMFNRKQEIKNKMKKYTKK